MSRNLPHSAEAEAGILGGILQRNEALAGLEALEVDDYFDHKHKVIFQAMRNLQAASRPIDVVTLENEIAKSGKLEAIGGVAFLGELTLRVPTADNVVAYAEIVRGHHAVRKAMLAGQSIIKAGQDGETEPSELLAESIGELQRIEMDLKSPSGSLNGQLTRRGFVSMSERVVGESARRVEAASRAIPFHNAFLADRLKVVMPDDLVILTASSGVGKTSLALDVAVAAALMKRRVGYFALEAAELELERRIKFRWIIRHAYTNKLDGRANIDYLEWMLGKCEDVVGKLDEMADDWFRQNLSSLRTYYKGAEKFDAIRLDREILDVSPLVDLLVLDHIHYVDGEEGDTENRTHQKIIRTLRDRSLGLGKPVVAVAHIKKPQGPLKNLVPSQGDIIGHSDIPKHATRIVSFSPAGFITPAKWYEAPTLVSVIKDRLSGTDKFAAVVMFDRRSHAYAETYTLGRLTKHDTAWEPMTREDVPRWASGHRDMDASMLQT